MSWILKIWLTFISVSVCQAQTVSLNEVRHLYKEAAIDHDACTKLISELTRKNNLTASIQLGYKGSAIMMKAKYGFNPFSKLSNFISGKKMLEKSIAIDPSNAELRYLRFTIQNNAPSFLGYKSDITTDKNFLVAALSGMKDVVLKQMIETYINSRNH